MANILPRGKQVQAIHLLLEGSSVRSVERITGIHRDTIIRLMCRVGTSSALVMDDLMRGLTCQYIQVDEIWGFVGKKQRHLTPDDDRNELGDAWTFVAIDADTKLVPSYLVGKRDLATTKAFISDLASRVENRIQLSSDGLATYATAVEEAFGSRIDYGRVVKTYEAEAVGSGRYSPPRVTHVAKTQVMGRPGLRKVSTSYIERQNLTMRMNMRRMTRLTNAFSKKMDNFKAAVSMYFAHYNFVRIHKTLRVTPAMEAGVTNRLWSIEDLIDYSRDKT